MRISVIIPAYNAAVFLPRCLKSVFAQTLVPDEVIVVDDGSTDSTAALAAELGATVIRRVNGGLSAARNTGIHNASCEWIALLDADDMWAPEKLARQAACIGPETVLVYTGIRIFDDHGVKEDRPAMDVGSAKKVLRYRNPITPSTVLVRRDAVMQGGGFREDIRACEDWEMWVRLQRIGDFEVVADPLTEYYVYPNSLSANPTKMLEALDRIIETTLLADLHGLSRWIWRHRIRAAQLSSAGLIARDNGLSSEAAYMLQSLRMWPSPFWEPRRFAMFAVSERKQVAAAGGHGMNRTPAPCPMCGNSGPDYLTSRTVSARQWDLVVCARCGQHYCDPAPTVEEIIGFYQGDYHGELRKAGGTEKVFGAKFARYRAWVVSFLKGGHSIDIGTATGLFPAMLKASGFDAEGTEYNRGSAEWGSAHYGIRIRVGGLEQIASEASSYDLITMTDVLEHTENPLLALQAASRALKPHGYMLITFPDIRSLESVYQHTLAKITQRDWVWSCCHIPLHVWEFTPKTARAMFDKAGFDVVGFRRSQEGPEAFSGLAGVLTLPLMALKSRTLARWFGTQMEFMIRKRA